MAYRRAKEFEHNGDVAQFEHWLKVTISEDGSDGPSAVKDLAWLIACQDRIAEGLSLLDSHRRLFAGPHRESMENLHIAILGRARRFGEAAQLCERFAKGAALDRVTALRRQQAVLARSAGDPEAAARLANAVLKKRPGDPAATMLLRQLQNDAAADDGTLSDLPRMCQHFLRTSTRRGLTPEASERGVYDEADVLRIQGLLTDEGRPAVQGELLLTLTWLHFEAPGVGPRRSPFALLREACLCLGEAALENRFLDTARTYAAEALLLSVRNRAAATLIDAPLAVIAATHLPAQPAPAASPRRTMALPQLLAALQTDNASLDAFRRDLVSYAEQSDDILNAIVARSQQLDALPALVPDEQALRDAIIGERHRLREESDRLESLLAGLSAVTAFHQVVGQVRAVAERTRVNADRVYLSDMARLVDAASVAEWQRDAPAEVLAAHDRVEEQLGTLAVRMAANPTRLAVEHVQALVDAARESIRSYRGHLLHSAAPVLSLQDLQADDYYIQQPDGSVVLSLMLRSSDGGMSVTDIRVGVRSHPGIKPPLDAVSFEGPLRGGESREINLRVYLARHVSETSTISVDLPVYCRMPLIAEQRTTREWQFSLSIRVCPTSTFTHIIPNPYAPGASGRAVREKEMFFGRRELLAELSERMSTGPGGQCCVLYGEGRCGKSSVMAQLQLALTKSCIVVVRSLNQYNTGVRWARAFVEDSLQEIRASVAGEAILDQEWSDGHDVASDPLGMLARVLRAIQNRDGRLVVFLLDEFAYMHESIKTGHLDPEFIAQWSGLLDAGLFSAVVAGMDEMLEFRRDFGPIFARSTMHRLTYFSPSEARELAEVPLANGSAPRLYRGAALEELERLTACHPWFTHILCDALVRVMNSERSDFVTAYHVSLARDFLVRGTRRLELEKIESLLAAANPTRDTALRDAIVALLVRLVRKGGDSMPLDTRATELMGALREKGILVPDRDGRLSIRVKLVEEWFRAMPDQEA